MSTGRDRISAWLRSNRGEATQEWIAGDIERVTGWHITRDRYSKYESGSLPVGKVVLKHFADYWATRGVGGPGDMEASGQTSTLGPDVSAYLARIDSLVELVTKLVEQNAVLMGSPPDALVQAAIDVREAEEAAALERERTTSTPPSPGDGRRDGARRRTSREGGRA